MSKYQFFFNNGLAVLILVGVYVNYIKKKKRDTANKIKKLIGHSFFFRIDAYINHDIQNCDNYYNDDCKRILSRLLIIKYKEWRKFGEIIALELAKLKNGVFAARLVTEFDKTLKTYRHKWAEQGIQQEYINLFIATHRHLVDGTNEQIKIILENDLHDNFHKAVAILDVFTYALRITVNDSINQFNNYFKQKEGGE